MVANRGGGGPEHFDGEAETSAALTYDRVRSHWVRQTHAYVRSLQLFHQITKRRSTRSPHAEHPSLAADAAPISAPIAAPVTLQQTTVTPVAATHKTSAQLTPLHARPDRGRSPLTRRQLEVARLIAQGLSNEQIATTLVLTPGTVGNHIGHILRRLGARNRAQVAAWFTGLRADQAAESGAESSAPLASRPPR